MVYRQQLDRKGVQRLSGAVRAIVLSGAVVASLGAAVHAAEAVNAVDFDLPAQPLAQSLNALAITANRQILFEDALVEGKSAPAVAGHLTTQAALQQLLAGSSLSYAEDPNGAITIRRAATTSVRRKPMPVKTEAHPVTPVADPPVSQPVAGQPGHWMLRIRGDRFHPANRSDAFSMAGPPQAIVPRHAIGTESKWTGDVALEYYLSKHFSTELSLLWPKRFNLAAANIAQSPNAAVVGSFRQLPGYLTMKYNLAPEAELRPYLGLGVNVTSFYDQETGPYSLSSTRVAPAAQAGFDVQLSEHWYANADVKWAMVRPDVYYQGTNASKMHIDPLVWGAGLAYRFGGSPAVVPLAASRDSDGDGVNDDFDKCPNTPSGVTVDAVGCPVDSDTDGVADYLDKCPNTQAGIKVDAAGCPLDLDADGVPDSLDKCPGTPHGVKVDVEGCEVSEVVLKGVNFETGSARLRPESLPVLDEIADILKQRAGATAEIHGYTDSVGGDAFNLRLSQNRARSVSEYLVSRGANAASLSSAGFGKANPIASNATQEGRAENRRVTIQFKKPVLKQGG